MKNSFLRGAAVLMAGLLLSSGCALLKGPPDPAKVERKVQATLDGERALIRSTVADSARAERLVALIAKRDELVAAQSERITRYREHMRTLNSDYDAERASFEEAVEAYNADREAWQHQVVELVTAMKAEATPDEWKAIAKYQLKRLNPRELAYDSAVGGR